MRKHMFAVLNSIRAKLPGFGSPLRLLIMSGFALLALALVAWLSNHIVLFFLSRSYVDQLAVALDINKYLATALFWATFGVAALFGTYAISFSRRRRVLGLGGLLALLISHSLILWLGTSGHFFERSGKPIKCYIITRDAIRYGGQPGTDPASGRDCRPVTPEIVERLDAYAGGARPHRLESSEPVFFEPRTGGPVVWYAAGANGQVELFDLMGFHPETGEELLPVSREIVQRWKGQQEERARQESRSAPQHIDPEKYGPFDPVTGAARVWYWRNERGAFEFYDRPGFHQSSGERLEIITREIIDTWRKQASESASQKCYVMTRDAVRYGDRPGIDPNTGRQCRKVTEELLERLHEYEKGNRPKRIDAANPSFFDLRTGEPIAWYHTNNDGVVELFDLMGFHPDTGEELLPVTREIADLWKKQTEEKQRRIPQRVDLGQYAPFDPLTGAPRVWYWRSDKGEYEFYDSAGFHPRTGESLGLVTREIIAKREEQMMQRKREEEKKVEADQRKIPNRVDLDKYAPFDPLTGAPRAWYWRSAKGDYEFYDGKGFHPRTGEPLVLLTKEIIAKREEEMLQRKREEEKRAEQEEQERRNREAAPQKRTEQETEPSSAPEGPAAQPSSPKPQSGRVRHRSGAVSLKFAADANSWDLMQLTNGAPVAIIGNQPDWYRVRVGGFGGKEGYLHHTWVLVDQYQLGRFDDRFIQVKSFANYTSAEAYARSSFLSLAVFEASNGWFAVALEEMTDYGRAMELLSSLKAARKVPDDAFVTYGNTYIRKVCCTRTNATRKAPLNDRRADVPERSAREALSPFAPTLDGAAARQMFQFFGPMLRNVPMR